MPKSISDVDGARGFGYWDDPVSRFMYHESLEQILSRVPIVGTVGDYGGGNGILKTHLPNVTTIDSDAAKGPDIVDDILTHEGVYDWVVLRYVLHYLGDYQVIELFRRLQGVRVLVIQFVNHDLRGKYSNSVNEVKYFRTNDQLTALMPPLREVYSHDYRVTGEFYRNRLGEFVGGTHDETLKAWVGV